MAQLLMILLAPFALAVANPANKLEISDFVFDTDELFAKVGDNLQEALIHDSTANRGYLFETGFATGVKFSNSHEPGKCGCKKMVACTDHMDKSCLRARNCFDRAKEKRCTRIRSCDRDTTLDFEVNIAVACMQTNGGYEPLGLSPAPLRNTFNDRLTDFLKSCNFKPCRSTITEDAPTTFNFTSFVKKEKDANRLAKCLQGPAMVGHCIIARDVADLGITIETTQEPNTTQIVDTCRPDLSISVGDLGETVTVTSEDLLMDTSDLTLRCIVGLGLPAFDSADFLDAEAFWSDEPIDNSELVFERNVTLSLSRDLPDSRFDGTRNYFCSVQETGFSEPCPVQYAGQYEDICFPGSAPVRLASGGVTLMRDLEVGDEVSCLDASGALATCMVQTFSHVELTKSAHFVVLVHGERNLTLSENHMVFVADPNAYVAGEQVCGQALSGAYVPAYKVKLRSLMAVYDPSMGCVQLESVARIEHETVSEYYAPITSHGSIFVDDVLASSFTDMFTLGHDVALLLTHPLLAAPDSRVPLGTAAQAFATGLHPHMEALRDILVGSVRSPAQLLAILPTLAAEVQAGRLTSEAAFLSFLRAQL